MRGLRTCPPNCKRQWLDCVCSSAMADDGAMMWFIYVGDGVDYYPW
jgi:hypothetical protein